MNFLNRYPRQIVFVGVAGCFFLSGFAALLYQMAWMRQFSTVFGTSEIAVATVLSAYMGGLALGAAISGRLVRLVRRPVLFYGVLEACIALSALSVPMLLHGAGALYSSLLGGQEDIPDASGLSQPLFYFVVAFVVLLVPTACMGATLPVLTKYAVVRDDQIGTHVGGLYSINTLGAVLGALVAGFVFLPGLGLRGTVWCGVIVNAVVFLLAVIVAKSSVGADPVDEAKQADKVSKKVSGLAWTILPIMALSGVCTFVYEVLWTRLLSHVLGGSVAAFAIMLASFLTGIALGSAIASRFARTRLQATLAFVICQIGIAVSSMLIYLSLNNILLDSIEYQHRILLAFFVLMPATLFIGATFPLAVRVYASGADLAARSSARVYSWNTVGAIFGAAFAGFFLVPLLKYEGTIRAIVLLNTALACIAAASMFPARKLPFVAAILVFMSLLLVYHPKLPENVLRFSSIDVVASGDILYYEVGRSSTVLVYEDDGYLKLRNNGLPEAAALSLGAPFSFNNQRMLGALPVLARPDTETALIVGLGAGTAVTGIPPTVKEIDVVELEPEVVEANRFISDRRKYQPLEDSRVSLVINDARSALALTTKKYDMIVSQPSHPWSAGASHLYTSEYMQMVSEHLNDSGVFLQWINSQFVDEELLKSLCATISEIYPNVRVYQWTPQVLFFLASDDPLDIERNIITAGRPFSDAPLFYQELGVFSPEDVVAALMLDEAGVKEFAAGSRVITDDFNMMAMESARLTREGRELNIERLADALRPFVPALNPESWVHKELGSQLNFVRIAEKYTLLRARSYRQELIGTLTIAGNPQAALLAGLQLRQEEDMELSEQMLMLAVNAMPDSNQAKYALVELWLYLLGTEAGEERVPEHIVAIASSISGSAKAVIDANIAQKRRDFQAIADLDVELSMAKPADPWFAEAVKLRVDWRNLVSNPEIQAQLADQAWQILDLAMSNKSDQEFFAMRTASAAKAGRTRETIESARGYIRVLRGQLDAIDEGQILLNSTGIDAKLRQLGAVSQLVEDSPSADDTNTVKTLSLLADLNVLSERLGLLKSESY